MVSWLLEDPIKLLVMATVAVGAAGVLGVTERLVMGKHGKAYSSAQPWPHNSQG